MRDLCLHPNKHIMEEKEVATLEPFSLLLRQVMDAEGRKNSWLASKLGIEHQTLLLKFKNHTWKVAEIAMIKQLLNLEYDG